MKDKASIRLWAKKERNNINIQEISNILANKVLSSSEYKNSKNILIFYPLKNEINLLSLLNDSTKTFYLPKINGDNLLCCQYNVGDETVKSKFNTIEPVCAPCDKSKIDLAIVPALAVDKNKYRLGYGGGFYDRLLKDFGGIKMVCIPQKFVLDTTFPEIHDIKMDVIITEKDDI